MESRQCDEVYQQIWGLLGGHGDQRPMGKFAPLESFLKPQQASTLSWAQILLSEGDWLDISHCMSVNWFVFWSPKVLSLQGKVLCECLSTCTAMMQWSDADLYDCMSRSKSLKISDILYNIFHIIEYDKSMLFQVAKHYIAQSPKM